MLLFIDSADYETIRFAIDGKSSIFPKSKTSNVLVMLNTFLKKQKQPLSNITKIVTTTGPGAVNGLRSAVAMAQGISVGLGIPLLTIRSNKVPADLKELSTMKLGKSMKLHYKNPAVN